MGGADGASRTSGTRVTANGVPWFARGSSSWFPNCRFTAWLPRSWNRWNWGRRYLLKCDAAVIAKVPGLQKIGQVLARESVSPFAIAASTG